MADINIEIPRAAIEDFCRRWKVIELALFGSAVRDDFDLERSDADVLVSFADEARWSLIDHARMQDELSRIFGRPVDLVSKRAVEESHNRYRKVEILSNLRIIHAT